MINKRLFYILGLTASFLIVAFFSVHARLLPLREFVSDESQEKASLLVMSRVISAVNDKTEKHYHQLTDVQKKHATQFMLNTVLSHDKDKAQQAIHNLAKTLDQESPEHDHYGYLRGSDSFYYLGLTRSILETGQIGSDIKGSKYLNPLMLYPDGHWEPLTLHPFLGAGLHTLFNLNHNRQPLMVSVSWLPIVLIVGAILFFFLCMAALNQPWPAALGAGSCIFFAPILLERSFYGWYDNDPYNIVFPFFILYSLFLMDNTSRSQREKTLLGLLCGLGIAVYALFWQGWVLIAAILLISLFLTVTLLAIQKSLTQKTLIPYAAIILATGLGIALSFGIKDLFVLFQEGWVALKNFVSPKLSLWPDLYIAVGELRAASFSDIIQFLGGWIPFSLAGIGIFASIKNLCSKENSDKKILSILTVIVYFCLTLYLSLGARRFILLCLAPMGILITFGLTYLASCLASLISKVAGKHKIFAVKTWMIFVIALPVSMNAVLLHYPDLSSLSQNRIYSDTWDKVMTYLRENTPVSSVVNAWWSPGHFITAMGQRAVVFDGATINYTDHAYWLASALMSSDEQLAIGILRMLNTGGTRATDFLVHQGLTVSESVSLLKHLLRASKRDAEKILQHRFSDRSVIKKILALTYPKHPGSSYLMTYNEMIEKSILLAFVAHWDIGRAENIRNNPNLQKTLPKSNTKDYIDFLWSMSGGMPRFSGILKPVNPSNTVLTFADGIHIDTQNLTCRISSKTYGKGVPKFLIFQDQNGRITQKVLPHANLDYSVVFGTRHNRPICALMDNDLADTLLMRLYFFQTSKTGKIQNVFSSSNLTERTEIDLFKIHF